LKKLTGMHWINAYFSVDQAKYLGNLFANVQTSSEIYILQISHDAINKMNLALSVAYGKSIRFYYF
jgi:hypothetical protein